MPKMENQQIPIPDDLEITPRKVKLLASKTVKDFLGTEILSGPGFFYSNVKKFVKHLGTFANFDGDLHVFFAKGHNPRYKELNLISEDGQDAVIRFYNNSNDRETECSIPDYKIGYEKNWALFQNEELFFFELDEIQKTLEPKFKKKVYYNQDGSILATRCIDLSSHKVYRITFEIEKYIHTLSFTLIVPHDSKRLKLVEAYSCALIQNLISTNNYNDSSTYAIFNKSAYSYYEESKDLLNHVCFDFIISTVDVISGSYISKIEVINGKVFSFMLPDNNANYITAFNNCDWQLLGPHILAECRTVESSEGKLIKKYSYKTSELSEEELDKIPSFTLLKDYVDRFIDANLLFVFTNNYDC